MPEPDYRVELSPPPNWVNPFHFQIDNQQRYVLYLDNSGTTYKLDTWTGQTWTLMNHARGRYWEPVWESKAELPPKED